MHFFFFPWCLHQTKSPENHEAHGGFVLFPLFLPGEQTPGFSFYLFVNITMLLRSRAENSENLNNDFETIIQSHCLIFAGLVAGSVVSVLSSPWQRRLLHLPFMGYLTVFRFRRKWSRQHGCPQTRDIYVKYSFAALVSKISESESVFVFKWDRINGNFWSWQHCNSSS